jgi:hypothetical protein
MCESYVTSRQQQSQQASSYRLFVVAVGPQPRLKRTLCRVTNCDAHAHALAHTCCGTGDPKGDGFLALPFPLEASPSPALSAAWPTLLCGRGGAGAHDGSSMLSSSPDVAPPHLNPSVPPYSAPACTALAEWLPPLCIAATEEGRGGRLEEGTAVGWLVLGRLMSCWACHACCCCWRYL